MYPERLSTDELILTEQVQQGEGTTQQGKSKLQYIKDGEVSQCNKKLSISRKRAAVRASSFGVIRFIMSAACWFIAIVSLGIALKNGVTEYYALIIIFSLMGYLIWPKKPLDRYIL